MPALSSRVKQEIAHRSLRSILQMAPALELSRPLRVEASWVPRTRSLRGSQLYGYGRWITELAGHPVEFAWGFGGQYIFVVPSLELVVVTTSSVALGDDRREYRQNLFRIVEKDVIEEIGKGT